VLLDDDRPIASGDQPAAAAKPRPAEDIQKIHGLVAAAVGFDADRGDQLTVENIAFEETPVEQPLAPPGAWQKYGPQVMEGVRVLGIVALGVLALFGVIRPMVRGSLAGGVPAVAGARGPVAAGKTAVGGARTVQDLEAEMDAQLSVAGPQRMPVLTRRVAALTQREPENAAHLLRTWLTEDER
jgi:flagellar M-ring protein FliF